MVKKALKKRRYGRSMGSFLGARAAIDQAVAVHGLPTSPPRSFYYERNGLCSGLELCRCSIQKARARDVVLGGRSVARSLAQNPERWRVDFTVCRESDAASYHSSRWVIASP
jgi:hypothetical protein